MEQLLVGRFNIFVFLIVVLLFGTMLLALELGFRLGRRHRSGGETQIEGLGTLEGGVLGLMGLLLAFTFSGAASRFDERRRLIVEEANMMGTSWLRIDLLPAEAQPAIRDSFRSYVDARIEAFASLPDYQKAVAAMGRADALQGVIWKQAVAATYGGWPAAATVVLPSLNELFDITTTRKFATKTHPPPMIYVLLGVLVLMSSLLAGYGMSSNSKRRWSHIFAFLVMVSLTLWTIMDLEYPRLGVIRVDAFDQAIVDVRSAMK